MVDLTMAIDPGNTESAYVVIDDDRRPMWFDKMPNAEILRICYGYHEGFDPARDRVAVEMVASYGMPVGADVFETCVWIGRFVEALTNDGWRDQPKLIKRLAVKMHHCHDSKAKDSHIRQALVDRFAKGQRNHGKGTKADPGWFYGFHRDIWQAYALAVYLADQQPALPGLDTVDVPVRGDLL